MIRYVFKDGPLRIKAADKANAQEIGEALAKIAEVRRLTPGAVVQSARDKSSPLHKHFEWDDKIAASAHRRTQARALIRSICVKEAPTQAPPVRAFHSIVDRGAAYRTLGEIRESAGLQERLLEAAERDLTAYQQRYRALTDICELLEGVKQKIRQRRNKNETRATEEA